MITVEAAKSAKLAKDQERLAVLHSFNDKIIATLECKIDDDLQRNLAASIDSGDVSGALETHMGHAKYAEYSMYRNVVNPFKKFILEKIAENYEKNGWTTVFLPESGDMRAKVTIKDTNRS